jgi:hypothetical protein
MIWLQKINFSTLIILCLTIGLAPFAPPHIYEKLTMLFAGELKKMIDWFDLFMHGTPWVLLLLKTLVHFSK